MHLIELLLQLVSFGTDDWFDDIEGFGILSFSEHLLKINKALVIVSLVNALYWLIIRAV